ncbi:hypothetical protein [Streptomyces sp. NPDC060194]|uniref:hypothetical protein n=1 Tax=Streptomyces sp. NPDC060194 TaxID=3347069 RepID=UPI003651D9E5
MKITRALGALAATAALLLTATACSDDSDPSGSVSDITKEANDAASSAREKAGEVASAASEKAVDAASQASDAAARAQASASAKVAEVKGAVSGKDDIELGDVTTSGQRSSVELTADNSTDEQASYTVTVNFRDQDDKLLDVTVVDVKDVAPGKSKSATVRSNRELSGEVKADVGQALRR